MPLLDRHRFLRHVVALSTVLLATPFAALAAPASGEPVWFGVSGPLTGQNAQYGAQRKAGFDLALDHVNAQGGIHGRPLAYNFEDSQSDPRQSVAIAQKLVNDKRVLIELGDFSSPASMAASPIYQRAGLVQLGFTNSHPDFTKGGDYIWSPSISQADAKARGLSLEGPLDGGRVRPDGGARVHANGAQGVASLAVAVRDLDATLARYRALLGNSASDDADTHIGEPVVLPGSNVRLAVIALGRSVLVLSSPREAGGTATGEEEGGGSLGQRLAARGEGPYALVLHTDRPQATGTFDLARAHGALIELDLSPLDRHAQRGGGARAYQVNSAVGG